MASTFDSDFAAAGFGPLIDQYGEDVTYKPRGGSSRTITAIVTRGVPEPLPSVPVATNAERISIEVFNDSTTGIASSEIDFGRDKISVAPRIGGTAVDMEIRRPQSGEWHDGATLTLELR